MIKKGRLHLEHTDVLFCDICGKETFRHMSTEALPNMFKEDTPWTHDPKNRRALVCMDCYDQHRDFRHFRFVAGMGWCSDCRREIGSGGLPCPYCGGNKRGHG
jgi:hypothetical protein